MTDKNVNFFRIKNYPQRFEVSRKAFYQVYIQLIYFLIKIIGFSAKNSRLVVSLWDVRAEATSPTALKP